MRCKPLDMGRQLTTTCARVWFIATKPPRMLAQPDIMKAVALLTFRGAASMAPSKRANICPETITASS